MYNSECKEVELICHNDVMDSIIDRFGEEIQVFANDMESFRIIVNTAVNHIFYSWIFGFGGKVKIKAPIIVKEDYAKIVRQAADCLEQ